MGTADLRVAGGGHTNPHAATTPFPGDLYTQSPGPYPAAAFPRGSSPYSSVERLASASANGGSPLAPVRRSFGEGEASKRRSLVLEEREKEEKRERRKSTMSLSGMVGKIKEKMGGGSGKDE